MQTYNLRRYLGIDRAKYDNGTFRLHRKFYETSLERMSGDPLRFVCFEDGECVMLYDEATCWREGRSTIQPIENKIILPNRYSRRFKDCDEIVVAGAVDEIDLWHPRDFARFGDETCISKEIAMML